MAAVHVCRALTWQYVTTWHWGQTQPQNRWEKRTRGALGPGDITKSYYYHGCYCYNAKKPQMRLATCGAKQSLHNNIKHSFKTHAFKVSEKYCQENSMYDIQTFRMLNSKPQRRSSLWKKRPKLWTSVRNELDGALPLLKSHKLKELHLMNFIRHISSHYSAIVSDWWAVLCCGNFKRCRKWYWLGENRSWSEYISYFSGTEKDY